MLPNLLNLPNCLRSVRRRNYTGRGEHTVVSFYMLKTIDYIWGQPFAYKSFPGSYIHMLQTFDQLKTGVSEYGLYPRQHNVFIKSLVHIEIWAYKPDMNWVEGLDSMWIAKDFFPLQLPIRRGVIATGMNIIEEQISLIPEPDIISYYLLRDSAHASSNNSSIWRLMSPPSILKLHISGVKSISTFPSMRQGWVLASSK